MSFQLGQAGLHSTSVNLSMPPFPPAFLPHRETSHGSLVPGTRGLFSFLADFVPVCEPQKCHDNCEIVTVLSDSRCTPVDAVQFSCSLARVRFGLLAGLAFWCFFLKVCWMLSHPGQWCVSVTVIIGLMPKWHFLNYFKH